MIAALEAPVAFMLSRIDELVEELRPFEIIAPLNHIFTPGLYVREIMLPKGSLSVSKKHRTEHPYVLSLGSVSVWTPDGKIVRLSAPFTGVTMPGTQRVIYAHEDTIWSTFHPTHETDIAKIEAAIIEPHPNPLLSAATLQQLKDAI